MTKKTETCASPAPESPDAALAEEPLAGKPFINFIPPGALRLSAGLRTLPFTILCITAPLLRQLLAHTGVAIHDLSGGRDGRR